MSFVGQLEEGSVRIDCVPEVGPEGEVAGSEDNFFLIGAGGEFAVPADEVVAEHCSDNPGEETCSGDGVTPEGNGGEVKFASGLSEEGVTK